ncbi:hypothetical protein [Chryseobacterium sp.]|uniref:tetratricopeptide repeat protein n=1 Tax=Chryseobacterium sp. TaxID=1871047 RepID=UPI00321A36DE
MNKILFILSFFVTGLWVSAQAFTDKALQQSALQLNSTNTEGDLDNLFKKFTKTKTSEKWQAGYYAAVSKYLKAELLLKNSTNPSTEPNITAGKYALGMSLSEPDNQEINILLGLITLQSLQSGKHGNPSKGEQKLSEYVLKAEKPDPNNPRLAILKAKLAEKAGNTSEADAQYQKAATGLAAAPGWGKQLIPTNK